ncbi:unnamed protein product [Amoebophrya sp. A25]|nr:unnamed protein product [Amoebophrya sp. A25]|eukprot:GSA25T00025915001.1
MSWSSRSYTSRATCSFARAVEDKAGQLVRSSARRYFSGEIVVRDPTLSTPTLERGISIRSRGLPLTGGAGSAPRKPRLPGEQTKVGVGEGEDAHYLQEAHPTQITTVGHILTDDEQRTGSVMVRRRSLLNDIRISFVRS